MPWAAAAMQTPAVAPAQSSAPHSLSPEEAYGSAAGGAGSELLGEMYDHDASGHYGLEDPYASGCEPWGDPCCDPCCEPCCLPRYYVSVGGLIFTRNRHRFQQVSYDDTDLVGQVLSTDSAMGHWDFGAQGTFGWYLDPCTGCAVELTYWGIYGDQVEATVFATNLPGNLNTAFDFSPVNIGVENVNDLFDAAQAHRVRRDFDAHNVEVNLVSGRFPAVAGRGLQIGYLAGFRYLRLTDEFYYASADASPVFGADLVNEAYYDIDVRNNLWGFQLGGRADWFFTPRFSLYAAPKFGLYANYMEHYSRIYNVNGSAVVGPGNPLAGGVFDIPSDKTIASFVGEIDLGLGYQFTPGLGAGIGYRALAVSGLAYATDQIPSHFADLPGVAMIDSNAHLILHGAYASVTWTW